MPEPQAAYDDTPPPPTSGHEAPFALTPPPSDATRGSAYVVSTDGRLVRVGRSPDGIELIVAGRHPLTLDQYQAAALQAVLDDLLTGAR
jgi:hypothetical protein